MTLRESCDAFGASLTGLVTHNGQPVDGPLMLWAFSGNESSYGQNRLFVKNETNYMPGGVYFRASAALQALYKKFGILACSSFGSFQIMAIVAQEMGHIGNPVELQDDEVCAKFMSKLIAERFVKHQGCKTLAELGDAYNSGNARDQNIPKVYIRDLVGRYEQGWPVDGAAA